MTTPFSMTRDINGYNGFGLEFSDSNQGTTLATGVAQSFTVSGGKAKYLAVFSFEPGASVWVAKNTPAALPTGAFASVDSIQNPTARVVRQGDTLSFITNATTAYVGVTLYAIS